MISDALAPYFFHCEERDSSFYSKQAPQSLRILPGKYGGRELEGGRISPSPLPHVVVKITTRGESSPVKGEETFPSLPRGACPEQKEILRCLFASLRALAQNDRERRAHNDRGVEILNTKSEILNNIK